MTQKMEKTQKNKGTGNAALRNIHKMENRQIHINKTVTRNFIIDIIANLQNFFGLNLTGYEKMVNKGMKQIQEELQDKKMSWFRYEITQLSNGALSITFYGEEQI